MKMEKQISLFGVSIPTTKTELKEKTEVKNEFLDSINYINGVETMTYLRQERARKEKEDFEQMTKEVNADGFIIGEPLIFWTHYEKQECIKADIEAVLKYSSSPSGLTHGIILKDHITGEYMHTWMITKKFHDYLVKDLKMVYSGGSMSKYTNPSFKSENIPMSKASALPKPITEPIKATITPEVKTSTGVDEWLKESKEKRIKELTEDLKKCLEHKYGFPVVLRILKKETLKDA
jgi:hypothetical protein